MSTFLCQDRSSVLWFPKAFYAFGVGGIVTIFGALVPASMFHETHWNPTWVCVSIRLPTIGIYTRGKGITSLSRIKKKVELAASPTRLWVRDSLCGAGAIPGHPPKCWGYVYVETDQALLHKLLTQTRFGKNCAWANWDFSSGCWRMFIGNFWKQLVNSIGCCNAAWCSHTPGLSHGIVPTDWSHVYRCLLHLFAFPPRQIRSHHKPKGLHWRTAPQFLTHVTLAEVMQVLRNEWMRAFVVCSCFGSRWGHPKAPTQKLFQGLFIVIIV